MFTKTKIKKVLKKIRQYEVIHRSAFDRTGAILLTIATVFSLTELGTHGGQGRVAGISRMVPVKSALESAERNETVRMPIKFDEGLRSVANTGE